ncbi:CTP synthase (pyrG) [Vairimorpha necatrix]|uniref:CTP synthase n=1 Tax=Vairimorpha necatrix TaxID=6039 RepID=A0AAX4J8N8_9MICR
MKHIVVTGGVVSGIGKGVFSSSIGTILKSKGHNVAHIKIDPYLNFSAGMMAPSEHGEVYVLNDGTETDLDLGNYERFQGIELKSENAITGGKIFYDVINKEKNGGYGGKTLQINPNCVDEIINQINKVSSSEFVDEINKIKFVPDVVIIELGGTVGDHESIMFLEALYKLKTSLPKEDLIFISVDFLVELRGVEHKTRPLQISTRNLRSYGLSSDIIICRGQNEMSPEIISKISTKCSVDEDSIILLPTLSSVYKVPSFLNSKGFFNVLSKKLNIKEKESTDFYFSRLERLAKRKEKEVNIGIIAKYGCQADSYASVVHSINFSANEVGVHAEIIWIDSEKLEKDDEKEIENLKSCEGIIVPGGFGSRGTEGKINAIKYCRENGIPFLGICLGMQLSVIEFARNVLGLENPTSEEFNCKSETQVIKYLNLNGVASKTLRLGANKIILAENSKISSIYQDRVISERHRHRFGIATKYLEEFENKGYVCSGKSECDNVAEIFELQSHRFFIGVQYHPEFNAKPYCPSKLLTAFIKASTEKL